MNKFIEKDVNLLCENFGFMQQIKNKKILITGATGLIGSVFTYFLCNLNDKYNLNITIYLCVRNIEKAKKFSFPQYVKYIVQDMKKEIVVDGGLDYIIHAASPTTSKYLVSNPVETINDTYLGTKNILELAKDKKVSSVVYLSSIEMYGQNFDDKEIKENDYGYINNLDVRSCYSEGKRFIECMCCSYCKEYDVPVKIARLTQTFGPGILLEDNRIFAHICKSVIANQDIVLHTDGSSSKNYLYITDAINAVFYILLRGIDGEAYNVANDETYISIKEMAQLVIDRFNRNIKLIVDLKENMGYAPSTKVNLNTDKLRKLGWSPSVSLIDMYGNTINYLKGLMYKEDEEEC